MKHSARLAFATAFAALMTAPAVAQEPKPAPVAELVKQVDIPFEQFTLPNGLRVVVHTDRKAPIVAVSVWYEIGSKNEPKGKTGFAHLFEHLMFYGSENSPGDYFKTLQDIGATDANGSTWFDRTNYYQTVPTPALERALFLESDRMGHLLGAIGQQKLDLQRGVVQNEKRQGDNQPYGMVEYAQLEGLLPATHPYGHSAIGSMADLDAASLEDVKNWFRDNYGPNNAVLVLAGDVDVPTAKRLAAKYFGDIKASKKLAKVEVPIPTLPARKDVTLKDRVATTRLYRYWTVPGLNDKDAVPLNIFASTLGGLASSRLDNALVRKEQLAVGVTAGVQDFEKLGFFTITADVKPGVDPAKVSARLDELLADLLRTGPTADEVQRVATQQVVGRINGLEQVGGDNGKAVALAEGALYSGDPGFYKKQLAAYAAATPASVKAAADKWLSRPVLAITVSPGAREAYAEAEKAPAAPVETAAVAEAPVKGTRGALPDVGQISELDFPNVERAKLSNGIELVYAQRTATPMTRAVMSFDAGVSADVAGKAGTQTLMLSTLEEGAGKRDSIQLAEVQERLGMTIYSASTADRTNVGMLAPSANLGGALDVFADVVLHPTFADAEVARVKNQQLARIAAELSSPNGLAGRTAPPLIYGAASPYAKLATAGGDPAAVGAMTRADLKAFHDAWLRPEKAKVFIVSDRPLAEVKAALESRFGSWRGTGAAGTKTFAPAVQSSPKIVLVDRPDSPQSVIIGGQLTNLKGTQEMLPYTMANDTLGGSFIARINTNIRETKGWSYGAYGFFNRYEHAVPYTVNAPVQADRTGDTIKEIRKDVKSFLTTNGITKTEFDRSITGAIRELSGNFETSAAVLGAMQTNDLAKRPDNYYSTLAEKYRALTAPQLDAAARSVLDDSKFVWVVVGDAAKIRPQLDSVGLPVEVFAVPGAKPASAGEQ